MGCCLGGGGEEGEQQNRCEDSKREQPPPGPHNTSATSLVVTVQPPSGAEHPSDGADAATSDGADPQGESGIEEEHAAPTHPSSPPPPQQQQQQQQQAGAENHQMFAQLMEHWAAQDPTNRIGVHDSTAVIPFASGDSPTSGTPPASPPAHPAPQAAPPGARGSASQGSPAKSGTGRSRDRMEVNDIDSDDTAELHAVVVRNPVTSPGGASPRATQEEPPELSDSDSRQGPQPARQAW